MAFGVLAQRNLRGDGRLSREASGSCKPWCTRGKHQNTAWPKKCKWSGCSACNACKQYVATKICDCGAYRDHSETLPVLCERDSAQSWQGRPNTIVCMAPHALGSMLCNSDHSACKKESPGSATTSTSILETTTTTATDRLRHSTTKKEGTTIAMETTMPAANTTTITIGTLTSTTWTSATRTTTTEIVTTSTTACNHWCTRNDNYRNTPWSVKCKWGGCSACVPCKQYVPAMVCSCGAYRDHSGNLPILCQKDMPEIWRGQPNTAVCRAPQSGSPMLCTADHTACTVPPP